MRDADDTELQGMQNAIGKYVIESNCSLSQRELCAPEKQKRRTRDDEERRLFHIAEGNVRPFHLRSFIHSISCQSVR